MKCEKNMHANLRTIDGNKLIQMNEALASYLQQGRLDEADKLDEEIIQYVGTDGRVVINRVVAPPRPMYMYAFNRSMLQMQHGYVQESVLSMIDVMETLFFGGVQEDIYFVFDVLAEQRGKRNRFRDPFAMACDHLLIAALCILRFPAISLSFFWKAKTLFKQAGLKDLDEFADTFIKTQYELLAERYKAADPEGAKLLSETASRITANCVIPARETVHWPHLVPFDLTQAGQMQKEEQKKRETFLREYEHRVTTYEDIKHINQLIPDFDSKGSMVVRLFAGLDETKPETLPNILEVLDVVCYDEERYAVLYDQTTTFAKLGQGAHDEEGVIDTVVNTEGKYLYKTKGLVKNLFYRGQTIKHNPCYPSLYRNLDEKQLFIEKLKLCEFSLLLHKHPSAMLFDEGQTSHLGNGKEEHHSMHIDDEALAQHYGIKTPYLDLTADKWVGAFFACCDYKYNPSGERDVYEKHTTQDVGVLYIYQGELDYTPDGMFRPIGMQPQSRPVMQAGYVRKMEEKEDFNTVATAIPFRFDAGCTSILYWLFDQSGHIQPPEVIELKAKRIVEEEKCFSEAAFHMAHIRYYPLLTDTEFAAMAKSYDLTSQPGPIVDFSEEDLRQSFVDRKQIEPYLRYNTRVGQIIMMTWKA